MAVYSGEVVNGVVLVKGVLLAEGTKVTILVSDDEEEFHLTPDMEAELEESIKQIERGEYVTWAELKKELTQTTREVQPR